MVILDPLNENAVHAYAVHRDQVDAVPDGIDTHEDARIEVMATLLRGAHFQQVAGLDIEIALREDLNLFRVDLCEVAAFTTLTRDKAPAIEYRRDLHDADHYWAAKKNFEYAIGAARMVDITKPLAPNPTVSQVQQFFEDIGLGELSPLAQKALARSRSKVNRSS